MVNSYVSKQWTVGDSATYEGEVVTIKWIDGLFADLQGDDGHIRPRRQVSLLRPVAAAIRIPVKEIVDTMSPGAAPLDLSGVEAAMARPLATITWEELVGPPAEEPEPVTIQPEPGAPTKTGRQYRTGGYRCELCPDLPPFLKSASIARHVRMEHPKPKPAQTATVTPADPAPTPVNGSFRSGLLAERTRLMGIVEAINVVLAHLDQH